MSYKVFLFENDKWLYCGDLSYDGNGCYEGRVINGEYNIAIDTTVDVINHAHGTNEAKLIWACDPFAASFDYNLVINDARERYAAGEPADYELKPQPEIEEDDDDEVPF